MKIATFFRKTKEQKAVQIANKLIDTLCDLELKSSNSGCALIMVWVYDDGSKSIEWNSGEKSLNLNKEKK